MLREQHDVFPNNVRNFFVVEALQRHHVSSALIGDVFEEIHRVTNERLKGEVDPNLIEAFTSLRELAGITLRVKKCWLKFHLHLPANANRENLADFFLLLQNINFHASTCFNRYFEDSLKEMFKFFNQNRNVQLNIAQTMSLCPHEALEESFKTVETTHRSLTNDMVEDYLFFLSQGAIVTNMHTCSLNGYLVFLRQ